MVFLVYAAVFCGNISPSIWYWITAEEWELKETADEFLKMDQEAKEEDSGVLLELERLEVETSWTMEEVELAGAPGFVETCELVADWKQSRRGCGILLCGKMKSPRPFSKYILGLSSCVLLVSYFSFHIPAPSQESSLKLSVCTFRTPCLVVCERQCHIWCRDC